MNVRVITLVSILILIISCRKNVPTTNQPKPTSTALVIKDSEKIQVLNFGTFHMGQTTDGTKTEFDEFDKENQRKVHEIAQMISKFQPTVIIVETPPEYDSNLQNQYSEYIKNPNMFFQNPSETELLAFEVGRLCGTKRIYGIDHKMNYNYRIGFDIENQIDSLWHNTFHQDPLKYYPTVNVTFDSLSLLDKLKTKNRDEYLDFLMTINADILTHAGTKDAFEGADEAALFYKRNLRMYSNLNRIHLDKEDRVFILMGAAHTAFFRDFISRSPKYTMVNTFDFLN